MGVKIISIFKKEEEINKVIDKIKNYSFDDLEKHSHFEFSVMEKFIQLKKRCIQRYCLIKIFKYIKNI